MTPSISRPFVSCVTAAALLTAQVPAVRAATPLSRSDYEACQAQEEVGFRRAIEALTARGLQTGLANLDYRPLVAEEWRRERFDDVVDKQVDLAVEQVKNESTWFELWSSLTSRDKAQQLATTVAERVYRSDPIRQGIERIATGVGKHIGSRVELAVIDTAGPAMQCMQAFLGRRYGRTVAAIVASDTGREYGVDPAKGTAQIGPGQILAEGQEGMAGVVVLVVRRQLSNMAARIGQRVIGVILGRLVSTVAGIVGVVLIAKDVWDFRHGVLPIVADEMKSRATKDKVRQEIATTIADTVNQSLDEIAQKTADRVVEIWRDFRRAHAQVVALAERNADFKRLLDTVGPADLPRLDEVTALVLASEGEPGIVKRLADGTLTLAVSSLPPAALDIAREQRSLETALRWSAVAGDGLAKVVEHEIHRRSAPDAFSRASLQRLLGLGDRLAVSRLAALQPTARDALFELDTPSLVRLARGLDEGQLASLARYLTGLEKDSALRILTVAAQSPARMAELASPRVREAIVSSRDQAAAVSMMLHGGSFLPDPTILLAHTRLVLDGRVSPILLWEKHGIVLAIAAVLALMLLMMLKRALFGARPRIIVQHTPERGDRRGDRG
jgi:hypothetical protein